jgi:hypothetical protein
MNSEHSPEVLSRVPKCKNAETSLMEKICELDKLCSHMSDSTVGCKSEVNEFKMLNKVSLNRNTHKTRLYIYQLIKM